MISFFLPATFGLISKRADTTKGHFQQTSKILPRSLKVSYLRTGLDLGTVRVCGEGHRGRRPAYCSRGNGSFGLRRPPGQSRLSHERRRFCLRREDLKNVSWFGPSTLSQKRRCTCKSRQIRNRRRTPKKGGALQKRAERRITAAFQPGALIPQIVDRNGET